MFKRNKFTQNKGNLKAFFFISIICLVFCYGIYTVDQQHHNVGSTNMLYIFLGTLAFLLLGVATAFKKVTIDSANQIVKVSFWGIKLKQIAFSEILKVEERSGSLPPAYYLVLRNNHLGRSTRLSPTYNQWQQTSQNEFHYQILPLINNCLYSTTTPELETHALAIHRFKERTPHLFSYFSVQKLAFSLICFLFSTFQFVLVYHYLSNNLSTGMILLLLFLVVCGILFYMMAFANFSMTYIDTHQKKLIQHSIFGFSLGEITFEQIEKIALRDTGINGLVLYTSLSVFGAKKSITIEKSLFAQHLSDIDRELNIIINSGV